MEKGEQLPTTFPAEGYVLVNPTTGQVIRTQEEHDADVQHMAEVTERHAGRVDLPSTDEIIENMMLDAQVVTFDDTDDSYEEWLR